MKYIEAWRLLKTYIDTTTVHCDMPVMLCRHARMSDPAPAWQAECNMQDRETVLSCQQFPSSLGGESGEVTRIKSG